MSIIKPTADIIKIAAEKAILKNVFRPNNVPWMNGELKSLIRKRNRLRRNLNAATRPAYLQKRKVAEKTAEAKRTAWHRHLQKILEAKNSKQAWTVVKSLSSPPSQESNKALKYNHEYALDKAKATAFVVEHARVSGRKIDKSSGKTIRGPRRDNRRLQRSSQQSLECPFALDELRRALYQLKPKKRCWPGRDCSRDAKITAPCCTFCSPPTSHHQLDHSMVPPILAHSGGHPVPQEK